MKKIYIIMTALLFSSVVYGQEYQVVDSTFTHTKLDQDSLYYDEMAYLDDYHLLDNIFVAGQIGISHSMSENTRFGRFFDNEKLSFNIGVESGSIRHLDCVLQQVCIHKWVVPSGQLVKHIQRLLVIIPTICSRVIWMVS